MQTYESFILINIIYISGDSFQQDMEAQVDEIIPGPTAELLFNKKCRGKKPRPWWKFWGKKKIHSTSITGFVMTLKSFLLHNYIA